MSDWTAARVQGETVTLWPMDASGPLDAGRNVPLASLGDQAGPIVACGLPGGGRTVPCTPLDHITHTSISTHIATVPGLIQHRPAALSHGSETAIAGYLDAHPDFDGTLLVTGTETLWAQISAREVVSFQTFLTPDLATALGSEPDALDNAFADSLSETLSRPDRLAQHLASARASGKGGISAHLIGAEIAAAKPYWLGQQIVILTDDTPSAYAFALHQQGAPIEISSLTETTLRGLSLAWHIASS